MPLGNRPSLQNALLAVVCVAALVTSPAGGSAAALQEDSGGETAVVEATPAGLVAEDVDVGDDPLAVERAVAAELDAASADDVVALPDANAVELRSDAHSREAFVAALASAGVDADEGDVRRGVTRQTLDDTVASLEAMFDETGHDGASAAHDGERITVRVPGADPDRVASLLESAHLGATIDARYPAASSGTEYERETVVAPDDVADVGDVSEGPGGQYSVPVTLTEAGAAAYADTLVETGFTSDGVSNCRPVGDSYEGYCLIVTAAGEDVTGLSLHHALAQSIESGEWESEPTFTVTAPELDTAEELRLLLAADPVPTPLSVESVTAEERADSGAESESDTDESSNETDPGDDSLPGPGVVGGVVAVLAAALLARRHASR